MKDDAIAVRWITGGVSVSALVLIFVFQSVNVAAYFGWADKDINQFLINRIVRFLLNDLFAIGLIYALFAERKYVMFALGVQIVGTILFLVPYIILKLNFPTYNGPLINFIHRLILNPTLMLLLIPAFYHQKLKKK